MMDLSEKGSSSGSEDKKKTCVDCQTTKTPLWRGGPAGPKSLCNACGIRARKRRRALLGLNKGESAVEKKKEKKSSHHHSTHKNNNNNKKNLNVSSKLRLLLGREVLLQRSTMKTLKQRKLGEEEQAAILLMALSCGSIYA